VSSKRWGDGGRKRGEDKQPVLTFNLIQTLPGVCGKLARPGYGIFPGRVNLPQSPSNLGKRESDGFSRRSLEGEWKN
jgi:hypothetical protein